MPVSARLKCCFGRAKDTGLLNTFLNARRLFQGPQPEEEPAFQ